MMSVYLTRASLGLAALLLLAGCSKPEAPAVLPPLVKTVVIKTSQAAATASEEARPTAAVTEQSLRAELAGTVLEVLVKANDTVQAGQALVRLDPRDARLSDSAARVQAAAARAELATAEADFARYTELRQKSFISEAEFGRRQAALAVARAQYEATLDRLGVNTLRAPRRARVTELGIQVGQSVSAGTVLVQIQIANEPVSTPAAATQRAPRPGRMTLPTSALLDGQRVMVVVPGDTESSLKVVSRAVKLGGVDDRTATIISGLAAGDRVVAAGAHLLVDGQPVRLLESSGR